MTSLDKDLSFYLSIYLSIYLDYKVPDTDGSLYHMASLDGEAINYNNEVNFLFKSYYLRLVLVLLLFISKKASILKYETSFSNPK